MRLRRQDGAAVVEFAILAWLLFMLLFGIIEFSLMFYDKAVITNASREGARKAIVFRSDATGNYLPYGQADIEAVVNNYAQGNLVTFASSPATPTTTVTYETGTPVRGETVTVDVTWQYDFLLLPNFSSEADSDSSGLTTLRAVSTMRME